jgi:DNA primase
VGGDEEAPLRAFESIITSPQVVICEGIGTALAIHQATGLPVIAALSAQNMPTVAQSLKTWLRGNVVICADNDGEKSGFKGQRYALKASSVPDKPVGITLPAKPHGVTPSGYDARDLLRDAGPEAVQAIINNPIEPGSLEKILSMQSIITKTTEGKPTMETTVMNPAQVASFFDTLNKAREETDEKRDNRIVFELKQTVNQGVDSIMALFEAHKRAEAPKQQDQPQSQTLVETASNADSPASKVEVREDGSGSSGQPGSGVGREYKIDFAGMSADQVLSCLDWNGAHALRLAGDGMELTQEQVLLLHSGNLPDLINERSALTEMGKLAYERLTAAKTAQNLEQQQLQTRNIDQQTEERKSKGAHKVSHIGDVELGG